MSAPERPTHENRLAHETSPYLLQHKDNPVDWWPWGPEALAEAKRSGRPILLSVGYAACHWCHVMAHESFEDPETAAAMNDLFVNIKVDREERPDIDQIYMSALHHLGEQGGWPLTMFLDPDGAPVWGGTYFPKTSRYGRPAFVDVLRELARLFREEPQRIEQNRGALMQRLAARARPQGRVVIGTDELDDLAGRILGAFDPLNGGLQGAPKFPQAAVFELVWRAGLREEGRARSHPESTTPSNKYFATVEHTLDRICEGGIYDHLGGGFSRYSVDERWLVPHFEKMLYDNAHLLALLALAWRRSGRALFRTRARETVEWLAREMTMAGGAFASSLDADSEGEEGKFYVWSAEEIARVLGPEDAAFFATFYDVTAEGNFEGHTILNRLDAPAASAEEEARLAALRAKLFVARVGRIAPGLDDKVLADWNGMMIAALVRAGLAFDEREWIEHAERAFRFVATEMARGDRLGHSWREGRLLFPGLASDLAWMTRAALALAEATGARGYLEHALSWQRALDAHHADDTSGGYYLTAEDATGLVVRPHATHDDAIENHNAVIAENLVRLAALTGDETWRARADRLFDGLLPLAAANAFGHAGLLNALDFRLSAAEIVVTGQGEASRALAEAALRLPHLQTVVVRATDIATLPEAHPLRVKGEAASAPSAFVCVAERCSLPATEPARIAAAVQAMRGPTAASS
jgi:uncharacterized protein YyaL (SSP411 family)